MIRVLDSAGSTLVEWGRQQQQQQVMQKCSYSLQLCFRMWHFCGQFVCESS